MRFKQVVASEGHKGPVFLPMAAFVNGKFDRRCEIVVADTGRNSSKMFKGLNMAVEKTLLFLRRKGHHERAT